MTRSPWRKLKLAVFVPRKKSVRNSIFAADGLFTIVPDSVIRDSSIRPLSKALYVLLAGLGEDVSIEGERFWACSVGRKQLGKTLCVSSQSIGSYIAELRRRGLLFSLPRAGLSSVICLCDPRRVYTPKILGNIQTLEHYESIKLRSIYYSDLYGNEDPPGDISLDKYPIFNIKSRPTKETNNDCYVMHDRMDAFGAWSS